MLAAESSPRLSLFSIILNKPKRRQGIRLDFPKDIIFGGALHSTLAAYRNFNGKSLFGQNAVHDRTGPISVGDTASVIERR